MHRLPIRLLAVALAFAGLVTVALQQQRAVRQTADVAVATAVAGYLQLMVPAARPPATGYAADQLVSTVSRLHQAAFWHAGLQVTVAGVALGEETDPPARAGRTALLGPQGDDTAGVVVVWGTVPRRGLPPGIWIVMVATFLAAGLTATRRLVWLWPLAGAVLVTLTVREMLRGVARTADLTAEAAVGHIAPLAGLVLLDTRRPVEAVRGLGPALWIEDRGPQLSPEPPGWRVDGPIRFATRQLARGNGTVVELGVASPGVPSRGFHAGLVGGGIILLLAMFPPIAPRRPTRLPPGGEAATIPG